MQKRSISYAKAIHKLCKKTIVRRSFWDSFFIFLGLEIYQSLIKSSFNKMQFQILEILGFFLHYVE